MVESYVSKIDPAGNVLFNYPVPGTFPNALTVGSDGSIYLTGTAVPGVYQTTPGSWMPTAPPGSSVFALKLNANGKLIYATYLPGEAWEAGLTGLQYQDGGINTQQNPAQPGSIVVLLVNGAGLESPTPADGTLAPFGPTLVAPLVVYAPGVGQIYPGFSGAQTCDVPLTMPPSTPDGAPIGILVGTMSASANLWVASY